MEHFIETTIAQHGFGIAAAAWLMFRTDKRLDQIQEVLLRLEKLLERKRKI